MLSYKYRTLTSGPQIYCVSRSATPKARLGREKGLAMKMATLKQGRKILELIEETPVEQLQKLLEGGYLSDLLKANVDQMNRAEFWKVCGLIPISLALHRKWRARYLAALDVAARTPSGLSGGI